MVEVEFTNVPPFNLVGPVSQTVAVGSNALLNVSASGTPPFQYQWFFNEGLLAGATNFSLSLTNVQLTNAGLHRVMVMNSFGSTNSTNAVLTVLTPVSITSQPQGGAVVVGSNFTFNVSAAGDAPVYQWRKNGANISGATNASLVQ